ncbi:hypothetical protein BDF22DRAFT_267237 [Syncephalis plumigaleata]|nr:hypothetical protein BDF22DRAFT_267237 [Syncephalis plumigaleata]
MSHFASFFGMMLCIFAMLTLTSITGVLGEGYMVSPLPRGVASASNYPAELKGPNTKGVCNSRLAGPAQPVSQSIEVKLTINDPASGVCRIYLLDENLSNAVKLDERQECLDTMNKPWLINLPKNVTGKKVLRWVWKTGHTYEDSKIYDQCADIEIN